MRNEISNQGIDAGLLCLRIGAGVSTALLFALKQSEGANLFLYHPGRLWPLVVLSLGAALITFGYFTRVTAGALTIAWIWALVTGLHLGQSLFNEPVRSALFGVLFFTLFLSGAGRFSLDALARRTHETTFQR